MFRIGKHIGNFHVDYQRSKVAMYQVLGPNNEVVFTGNIDACGWWIANEGWGYRHG